MALERRRRLALAATAALYAAAMAGGARSMAASAVTLPIEVVGENGTTSRVTVDVPAARASEVRSLWMQIHGLAYADMISVRVNDGGWASLSNETVEIAEPGKSYGGIGGGYATLEATLALPAGVVAGGANTLQFRFNRSDGIASGFRVVAFNLLTSGGPVLGPEAFAHEDPAAWTPPIGDPEAIRAGEALWLRAALKASSLPNAAPIRAHCADCHAQDGRDLKFFAFSNESIAARSRFHGLSDLQGRQIASYIRSRPVPSPGRPWNPPYQPGPGLDTQPVANWAAGAGLEWALDSDTASLPFIFSAGAAALPAREALARPTDWAALVPRITRTVLHPDGNLNPREIPIALQLPDWNHWLPRVHPIDAWGQEFERSEFADLYGGGPQSLRRVLASPDLAQTIASGRIVSAFDRWTVARRALLKSHVEGRNIAWSPELGLKAYSTQLWQLVKTWEMTQEFGLEGRGRELFGPSGEPRTWLNTIPASTAPAAVNIPDGPSGMGGRALTNEYFDAAWYQLQTLVNSGNHRHRNRLPVDWLYMVGRFQDLFAETRRPEPARLLVAVIKAMQSTDPRIGPDDVAQGWRPGQNLDPTIMVNDAWAPVFQPLPANVKRAITEAFLGAWLDKNQQYPIGRYFRVGLSEASYAAPANYASLAGGKAWEAAPQFLAAGVSPELVAQLRKWGDAFTQTATRFQYSPGGNSRTKPPPKKGG
jgi:hypothetical protein